MKNKLKAIWRIIWSKHFYLITANRELQCEDIKSSSTDEYTISTFIHLYWKLFYKSTFLSKKDNELYL